MRHAYRLVTSFPAIFLLCLSALPTAAQNESFEAAEGVSVSINSVMSGGLWTRGKDEGFFRTVITADGVEHVVNRLYIQWLKINTDNQTYELVRTVNVKEFTVRPARTVSANFQQPLFQALRNNSCSGCSHRTPLNQCAE